MAQKKSDEQAAEIKALRAQLSARGFGKEQSEAHMELLAALAAKDRAFEEQSSQLGDLRQSLESVMESERERESVCVCVCVCVCACVCVWKRHTCSTHGAVGSAGCQGPRL
jgi:hypothetical protein